MTMCSAVSILLLIAAIPLATDALTIDKGTIAPVIIQSRNSAGTCPSTEARQTTIERIQNDIKSRIPMMARKCGDGLWYRVAYFDMKDPTQHCPSAWREYTSNSVRICGRPVTSSASCQAILYTTGRQYSKVCGRVIGYQYGSPDGFFPSETIDQPYADGISVTYGTPRNHVWTFAATVSEGGASHTPNLCPCASSGAKRPPAFVDGNYYCESGNPTNSYSSILYDSDKLWDGQQCDYEGTCCTGPPWFSVELASNSTDDIEVRVCGNEGTSNEDSPVELLEIYIQ